MGSVSVEAFGGVAGAQAQGRAPVVGVPLRSRCGCFAPATRPQLIVPWRNLMVARLFGFCQTRVLYP